MMHGFAKENIMAQTSVSGLTSQQVEQYDNDGYTLYQHPVFAPEKFARLKQIFEENLALYGEDGLDIIHTKDDRLLEFLLSKEVLDLIEPVIGPNIGLWSSHFISKPAGVGKATPWHEDSAYWNGLISTMDGICTVWLAIDVVDKGNGAMKVIPGTHKSVGGFSAYEAVDDAENIFGTQIKPELIKEEDAVYFELQPNECSLHEARIIHGAEANTSERRRAGYTMRYFPTTSKIDTSSLRKEHKIWLARGRDIAGNTYANVD
jgi:hypothetical protein